MYYITEKTSETGKKFQNIFIRGGEALDAQKVIAKELGFSEWRDGYWLAYGGFSAIVFEEAPDPKVWKKIANKEYMPKLNTKAGKEIQKKLDSTPKVTFHELNQCIGFNGAPFHKIGYNSKNENYFGIEVFEKWNIEMPQDCKEVTSTEYKTLFQ